NLGEFSLESFEHEFTRIFINKFDAIVAEKISQVPKKERAELRLTSDLELIKYFLLNGRLPWWGDEAGLAFEELIRGIFKNRLAEISDFFKENYNNNAVWERASYQFNDEILGVIIQLFVELKDAQKLLEEVLEKASSDISSYKRVQLPLMEEELKQLRKITSRILVFNATLIFTDSGNTEKIKSILVKILIKELVSTDGRTQPGEDIINKLKEISKDLPSEDESPSVLKDVETSKPAGILKSDKDEEEKLIVRHAGIILLSPYLKTFFTKTGLLNDNIWLSKEAQHRGVFLLKYLSTGITKNFEYQLILEKLLCGIMPEEPVPSEIILNNNEMEESEQLLKSVIENWSALKNTSVQGLRETFLKRDGVIIKKDINWLLQIERKTVDILLESIPWGFSTIRLPWNEYLIITEW